MKKIALVAVAAGLYMVPAVAQNFTIHGEVRTRGEFHSNILDFQDHNSPDTTLLDDDFDLWPYRVRIGAHGEFSDNVSSVIEMQAQGFFGSGILNPNVSAGDPVLQAVRGSVGTDEVILYQGYIDVTEVGGSAFNFRIGRQEHTLGNELHMGDLDFYNGIAFDGARLYWDFENWDLDAFYYMINDSTPVDLLTTGRAGDDDVFFMGVTAGFDLGDNGQRIEPYLLRYHDGGNPLRAGLTGGDARIWTIGAQYGREVNNASDIQTLAFDWNIEVALQTGDIFVAPRVNGTPVPDFDHSANVIEGWFGFNWEHGSSSRSRVHIGIFQSSGDDDTSATDRDNEWFFPLFPDNHSNNRLGNMDLFGSPVSTAGIATGSPHGGISNITDINVGYEWWGNDGEHYFLAAIHALSLTEEVCTTAGGGVGVQTAGACGAGTTPEDDIGMEIDLRYRYNFSANLSLEAGVARLMTGDLIDRLVPDGPGVIDGDDAMRIWGSARLRF